MHDRSAQSPLIRRALLLDYLVAVRSIDSRVMWMGRDLGYRGGRRTGIALTDEFHLPELAELYQLENVQKVTAGPVIAERTAAEVWSILGGVTSAPMLWNVFPFHPHAPQDELSNRKFTSSEFRVAEQINLDLISILNIERIVGIGQDAATYAAGLGVEVQHVRHPSYGGVVDFRAGMSRIYGLNALPRQGSLGL